MFHASINSRRGIALVRISGDFGIEQIAMLDVFVERLARRSGSVDLILDFSGVSEADIPVQHLAKRSERPPLWPDRERILVAPQPILHAMMRLFAGYQEHYGMRRPLVVSRLDEALKQLDTRLEEFESVEMAPCSD